MFTVHSFDYFLLYFYLKRSVGWGESRFLWKLGRTLYMDLGT